MDTSDCYTIFAFPSSVMTLVVSDRGHLLKRHQTNPCCSYALHRNRQHRRLIVLYFINSLAHNHKIIVARTVAPDATTSTPMRNIAVRFSRHTGIRSDACVWPKLQGRRTCHVASVCCRWRHAGLRSSMAVWSRLRASICTTRGR